jgi:hypothetical protein
LTIGNTAGDVSQQPIGKQISRAQAQRAFVGNIRGNNTVRRQIHAARPTGTKAIEVSATSI